MKRGGRKREAGSLQRQVTEESNKKIQNINDTTPAPSRTKTKVAVSVMECLQHSPPPKHVWKISKVCRFLTLVFISIVTLGTY